MTEQSSTLTIEQALFGYSDGHRQLAASTLLSSADAYDLATKSDLASNARLGPGASYLGGFTLKDSGAFAFIKTWPAPEMTRPGCVWSHVLILPRKFLTGQVNLGVLKNLFHKPGPGASLDEFSRKIEVKRLIKSGPADRFEVQKIISAYYAGRSLHYRELPGETFEAALLAVWSQQWPKLRAAFQFKMVFGSAMVDDERGLIVRVGPSAPSNSPYDSAEANPASWISAASDDATSPTITPLRRFLWRYGKDASRPRTAFRPLVELYLADEENATRWPDEILTSFPKPLDGATLKRDALGVTPAALALTKRLDGENFVTLALRSHALTSGLIKREELEAAVGTFGKQDLRRAAIALGQFPDASIQDATMIAEAVSRVIESDVLSDETVPKSFVMSVLTMRPQLIDGFDATRLEEDDILALLKVTTSKLAVDRLIATLMLRPPSEQSRAFIARWIGEAFVAAVRLSMENDLHRTWRNFFPLHAREVIAKGLGELSGSRQVSHAVALIDFSTEHDAKPLSFVEAASRTGPKAIEAEQTDLDAYLLILCSRWNLLKSMQIVAEVLPRLRVVALADGFSDRTRALLDRHLPYLSEGWDFNRRLLKLLRNARRDGANIDRLVESMALSKEELLYVFDEDSDGFKSIVSRLFWSIYRI
ncbi:MAG: hypothetical protein EOS41_14375 [Mesorhizobium sp.]|uniref:GAP1-N1 domain-containing protein n=1 Tax=Mesorhizobium sp. TaxID=1871066 RepID=UPI000FE5F022|nr:hypothetical protein [Mesorhizobium sp.]RWE24772.1 MAG: hypothetical protein EOS41_14375 [Mesorhizobium sp.]